MKWQSYLDLCLIRIYATRARLLGVPGSNARVPLKDLLVNATRGSVICEVVVADKPVSRLRGLMGRKGLASGEGLLLTPAPSIHTAFMRFAIDVVFLDRQLKVLRLVDGLRPWRAAAARAHCALELAAGELASLEVEVGDQLRVVGASSAATLPGLPGAHAGVWFAPPSPAAE
jgi:uncharacterized protein